MAELTVEMTYSQALLQAAADVDKIDLILKEGKELIELFHKEPDFHEFLSTPVVSAEEKKQLLNNVFKDQISQELLNFLFILIDKSRCKLFERIMARYEHLIDESKGYAVGKIMSVVPLNDKQLSEFEMKTSKLLQKKVKLINQLEPSILGGVRILIEGKVIDATIKKRLDDLKESLG